MLARAFPQKAIDYPQLVLHFISDGFQPVRNAQRPKRVMERHVTPCA